MNKSPEPTSKSKKAWVLKLGIILMIACVPFFLVIAVIPFFDWETRLKVTLSTISLVFGEVFFWAGGLLVGKELLARYKFWFNPLNWFKKRSPN